MPSSFHYGLISTALISVLFVGCGGSVQREAVSGDSPQKEQHFQVSIKSGGETISIHWVGDQDHYWSQEILDLGAKPMRLEWPEMIDSQPITAAFFSVRKLTLDNVEVGTFERWNVRWDSDSRSWSIPLDCDLLKKVGYEHSRETIVISLDIQTKDKRYSKEVGLRFFIQPKVPVIKTQPNSENTRHESIREEVRKGNYFFESKRGRNSWFSPIQIHLEDSSEVKAAGVFLLRVFQSTPSSPPEEKRGIYQAWAMLQLKGVEVVHHVGDLDRMEKEWVPWTRSGRITTVVAPGEEFELRPIWGLSDGTPQIVLPPSETYVHEWRSRRPLPEVANFPPTDEIVLHQEPRTNYWTFTGLKIRGNLKIQWTYSELHGDMAWPLMTDEASVSVSYGDHPEQAKEFPGGNGWL